MPISHLNLATRSGLPDTIVTRRAGHPRSAWHLHANYGALTRFWLGLHADLRREAAALTDRLRSAQVDPSAPLDLCYAASLDGFIRRLDMHHLIEDARLIPRFRSAEPRALAAIDVLEGDHHLIEEKLEALGATGLVMLTAAAADGDARRKAVDVHAMELGALVRMLDRHLADEEEIVVPAMLQHGERAFAPD